LKSPGRSAYVELVLAPTLRAGEIVVMDNVRTPEIAGVREAIEAKGASILYPLPHSPNADPIEKSFSKIKSAFERLATRSI
jgi:transposase